MLQLTRTDCRQVFRQYTAKRDGIARSYPATVRALTLRANSALKTSDQRHIRQGLPCFRDLNFDFDTLSLRRGPELALEDEISIEERRVYYLLLT